MGDVQRLLINHFCEGEEERAETPPPPPVIEQFVQDVRDFSSQYGSDISISYTAYNITGKPSKFPDYGDFPQAFVMRTYGKWWSEAPSRREKIGAQNYERVESQDYIDVVFEHKVRPVAVSVYETYNPGSVVRVWAGDGAGGWALLWSGPPQPTHHHLPLIFSPPLRPVHFLTNMLRLEFDHSQLDYYTELDAVLLRGYSSLGVDEGGEAGTRGDCASAATSSGRRCLSPEEDKQPPGRTLSPVQSNISHQVLDLELWTWHCREDMKTSLRDLNNLAKHYMDLLDDINKGMESVNASEERESDARDESSVGGCSLLASLPDETVLDILSRLDLVSLSNCCRVDRHLRRLASDSMLYTELGLKPYWSRVNSAALESLAAKCQHLQKLDLSWCGNYGLVTPSDFASFIQRCGKSLTHLRLDSCKFVEDVCITAVSEVCLKLKELTLRNCTEITSVGYQRLSALCNLERLDLYRTYIENEALVGILKSCGDLRHIVVGSCIKISVMDEVAQVLGTYNRKLISADFWKTYSLTPVGVKALCNCTQLEEIDLGWCLGVSIPGDCLWQLASSCRKLKKLFMAALRGISDRDLAQFIVSCPHLEQIDLLGVRNVSPNICLRLLKECKNLRLLDVSFCDQIPDHVVESWTKQFPQVSIKRSFQREQPLPPRIHLHPNPAAFNNL